MSAIEQFQADGAQARLYDYPLNHDSVVFDVGGYLGGWTGFLLARTFGTCPTCGCDRKPRVFIFEPIAEFAEQCRLRFIHSPNVEVIPTALGDRNLGDLPMRKDGAATSQLSSGAGNREYVRQIEISQFCEDRGIAEIDLISINIEGGEYALLDQMISSGLVNRCRFIQVQFHESCSGSIPLRSTIQKYLRETHELSWEYPFVWESWKRK